MAETFTNAFKRAVGVVTTSSGGVIGAASTIITGISTEAVSVGNLVDNEHFIGGTKVMVIGSLEVTVDTSSTNTVNATSQHVNFLGLTPVYTSPAPDAAFPTGQKSILVGGTLANNTNNQVSATVQISSGSTSYNLLYKIPVPAGSSVVISDAGKTLLLSTDEIHVASSVASSLDVSLSILQGVG